MMILFHMYALSLGNGLNSNETYLRFVKAVNIFVESKHFIQINLKAVLELFF